MEIVTYIDICFCYLFHIYTLFGTCYDGLLTLPKPYRQKVTRSAEFKRESRASPPTHVSAPTSPPFPSSFLLPPIPLPPPLPTQHRHVTRRPQRRQAIEADSISYTPYGN